jgi:hypothetical protein
VLSEEPIRVKPTAPPAFTFRSVLGRHRVVDDRQRERETRSRARSGDVRLGRVVVFAVCVAVTVTAPSWSGSATGAAELRASS